MASNIRRSSTLDVQDAAPHVLLVSLNRPEVMNAVNTQMGRDLLEVWSGLATPGDVRAVVLTGSGNRAFCAGGDLKERNGMTREQWQAQHEIFERQYWALLHCPVPVIGAANGHAFGGGTEMLLACDFVYAAHTARFALTEVTLGIMPGTGGTQFLPRAVGERRAKEIILLGKPFSAEDAFNWGMVNRLCAPEDVVAEALATASAIAANAPLSVRQAKKSIHHGLDLDLKNALLFEIEAYNRLIDTEDRLEGVKAYNEKRKPEFKGR
ncbi:MAG: enoyl-CoA hydratase/isomerase family protein [Xanthobacteraceae bacterium]